MVLRQQAVMILLFCMLTACASQPEGAVGATPESASPQVTTSPASTAVPPVDPTAQATESTVPTPTPYPFDTAERVNALGEPMVTALTPRAPIAAGTRIGDLLADPGRYFEQEEFDPSDIMFPGYDYDYSPWASYRWLSDRPDDVVVRAIEADVLRQEDVQPETFIEIVVARAEVPDGTTIAQLLGDQDRYLRREVVPTWESQPYNALNERTLPYIEERAEQYATCTIVGPVAVGDPIIVKEELETQVWAVTDTISAGTTVDEVALAPTVWLSARIAPGCDPSLIHSVRALQQLQGLVALRDIDGGNLTARMFGPPGDLPNGVEVRPTPIPAPTSTPRPLPAPTYNVYVAAQDVPAGLTMQDILRDPSSYLQVVAVPVDDVVSGAVIVPRADVLEGDLYSKLTTFERCAVELPVVAGEQFLFDTANADVVMTAKAVAAGTTILEIRTDPENYLAQTWVPACEITPDNLLRFEDVTSLDSSLFLRSLTGPGEVLKFSSFGDTLEADD